MSNLANAIALASTAHINDVDKGGNPYILHPLRILFKLMQKTNDQHTLILGVLHDVIEDTYVTIDDLIKQGYSKEVTDDLQLMTKIKGEDYEGSYIPRIARSYRCILVKLEDLTHNSDIRRQHIMEDLINGKLDPVKQKEQEDNNAKRMAKYHRSYVFLLQKKAAYESSVFSNIAKG